MDKLSYIYGMVTAFCECVAAGCKPIALSPPLTDADFEAARAECDRLISAHDLKWYHEENPDIPAERRRHWLVMYARDEAIAEYLSLREKGENVALNIAPFEGVLGYSKDRISSGYDAYKEYFG